MSVPLHKRTLSEKQYYINFIKIYDSLFYYTAKDFGIKSIVRDLKAFTNNAKMSEEDKAKFIDLCEEYSIGVESQYPQYILEVFRKEILGTLNEVLKDMTIADEIYPATEYEYNMKKSLQHNCIGKMMYLLQILQRVTYLYPVNQEKYVNIVTAIDNCIKLFIRWKKSTNSEYKKIQQNIINTKNNRLIQNKIVETINSSTVDTDKAFITTINQSVGVPDRKLSLDGHIIEEPFIFI